MPLLSAEDLSGADLTPDQALSRAEALVASTLCPGLPDLTLRTWTADYRMRNTPRGLGVPLYGKRRLGPEVLRYWPITGLVGVTQDGVDRTAEAVHDTFSVRLDALATEFSPLSVVTVTFTTGWTADGLPLAIREAIVLFAQGAQARPVGLQAEVLGDVENRYFAAAAPAEALALLAPWRYLGV